MQSFEEPVIGYLRTALGWVLAENDMILENVSRLFFKMTITLFLPMGSPC